MDTNSLYQEIQAKKEQMNSAAANLALNQRAAPQIEADLRKDLMGDDAGINSLRNQFSDGVMQLYEYDREKSKSYLSPELEAKGLVADPTVGMNESNTKFMGQAKANQEIWKQLDKRKTVLGDLVKSSMDRYNAELAGDKTLIDAADKSVALAIQQLAEQRLQEKQDIELGSGNGDYSKDVVDAAEMISSGTGSLKDVPISKRTKVTAYLKDKGYSGVNLISAGDKPRVSLMLELGNTAKKAEAMLKNELTGPLNRIGESTKLLFNKANPDFVKLNTYLGDMKTAILNARSGTAITVPEMKQLEDFIIKPNDSDQEVKIKLKGLVEWTKNKGQATLTTGSYAINYDDLMGDFKRDLGEGVDPISSPQKDAAVKNLKAKGYSESEIEEYLKAKGL